MTTIPSTPTSPAFRKALDLVNASVQPAIAHHSIRTFLHASLTAEAQGLRADVDYRTDLLGLACVLHDVGTADRFNGPQRFEVDGADAAAEFLTAEGFNSADVDEVWEAIALHTSPGIAERRGPISMLTRLGVMADFGAPDLPGRDLFEQKYPRLDIERVLADAVVAQALAQPSKAPSHSWPGLLVRAQLADPNRIGLNPAF